MRNKVQILVVWTQEIRKSKYMDPSRENVYSILKRIHELSNLCVKWSFWWDILVVNLILKLLRIMNGLEFVFSI